MADVYSVRGKANLGSRILGRDVNVTVLSPAVWNAASSGFIAHLKGGSAGGTGPDAVTLPNAVATLITARRLEQVPADQASADSRLSRAEDKLESARKIADIDVEITYVTAYDATRIAVTAHMLAIGYRVRAVGDAHEAVGA